FRGDQCFLAAPFQKGPLHIRLVASIPLRAFAMDEFAATIPASAAAISASAARIPSAACAIRASCNSFCRRLLMSASSAAVTAASACCTWARKIVVLQLHQQVSRLDCLVVGDCDSRDQTGHF